MSGKKISPIKILKRITPLVFKTTPFFFGLFIVITILHGLSWAVKILFLQKFYDTTGEVINTGGSIKITVKPPETIYRPRNCQNITITATYIQKLLLLLQAINFS